MERDIRGRTLDGVIGEMDKAGIKKGVIAAMDLTSRAVRFNPAVKGIYLQLKERGKSEMAGKVEGKRWKSLDGYRGLAVLGMLIINGLSHYSATPAWLKHAPWNGYTPADAVAPMFLFAMGIAYHISLTRRLARDGFRRTLFHFVRRYVTLFLFGLIGSLLTGEGLSWGVLQMLGGVGLFCFGFMFLSAWLRLAISFVVACLYQVFAPPSYVAAADMGGPLAIPSWAFILVYSATLGEWIRKRPWRQAVRFILLTGAVFVFTGFALSYSIPFNKHLVSLSYVLFSSGISSVLFALFYLGETLNLCFGLLEALGKNALTLFILGNSLILIERQLLPRDAPLAFPLLGTLGVIGISLAVAEVLERKGLYFKL
ncbi:hypothetical protein DRP77_03090 [Candidatus Poribacteria bacterium]|nr:MAG: hypothetical protein DRP77_03090 [Candidatus Poribacteria bacterium]